MSTVPEGTPGFLSGDFGFSQFLYVKLREMDKRFRDGLVLLLALQPCVSSQATPSQRLLKCDDARVVYTPFDKTYSNRIVFKSVTDSENPPQNVRKEYLPERNMWM